jgi:predicted amidophosphoribosyltransferase
MTNGTTDAATTRHQCWSCKGEVAPTDAFCRHCGMRLAHDGSGAAEQPNSPSVIIHARLVSIEKLLLKTIFGVVALLLLVGWIALQMHHFGKD